MFPSAKRIFSNPGVIKKIAYTLLVFLVFKLGTYVPIPLVSTEAVRAVISDNDFLSVLNAFSGGGLSKFSILALGITPYITASIIVQMFQMIIPRFHEWSTEGDNGKQKLNRITRYVTIGLAFVQALGLLYGLASNGRTENLFIPEILEYRNFYWFFMIFMALILTAGSSFTMWLADLITRHGVGNGSSMIISAGIITTLPSMLSTLSLKYLGDAFSAVHLTQYIVVILLYVLMILGVVYFESALRHVRVQYANRQANSNSDIPIKLNSASVMPVIFASTIMSIPLTIIGTMGMSTTDGGTGFWLNEIFSTSQPIGIALYVILIFFFSFFYSFIVVDPEKIADNLQKQNSFIPGYQPGEETKNQLSKLLFRITLIGGFYLIILALVPIIVSIVFGFTTSEATVIRIGGTSLIIVVGVAIETFRQIETDVESNEYKGFLD